MSRCLRHAMQRMRSGPDGRRQWLVIVDSCWRCGVIRPAAAADQRQLNWIKRWNRRIKP